MLSSAAGFFFFQQNPLDICNTWNAKRLKTPSYISRPPWGKESLPRPLPETVRRSLPFETGETDGPGPVLVLVTFVLLYSCTCVLGISGFHHFCFRSSSELIQSSTKTTFLLPWKSSMTWEACDILPRVVAEDVPSTILKLNCAINSNTNFVKRSLLP